MPRWPRRYLRLSDARLAFGSATKAGISAMQGAPRCERGPRHRISSPVQVREAVLCDRGHCPARAAKRHNGSLERPWIGYWAALHSGGCGLRA
jgi:hypothetical protein